MTARIWIRKERSKGISRERKADQRFPWRSARLCLLLLMSAGRVGFAGQPELAKTPPMGWNSWNRFHLKIDDSIIREQAAALVKSGMKKAGYEYVVIDGGWEGFHDDQGVFIPTRTDSPT